MVQDKIKEIAELSYKANITKDKNEKEKIEQDVQTILKDLKKSALDTFKDESDIKRFLDNIVNFNNYSFNNLCLIWMQNHDARYVASYRTYLKMGYHVNKDETGIKILVPSFFKLVKIKISDNEFEVKPLKSLNDEEMKIYRDKNDDRIIFYKDHLSRFNVGAVFDVSQTNMPMNVIDEKLNPVLDDPRADSVADIFIKSIYRDGFKVKYENIVGGAKGYCNFDDSTIVVKNNLSNLMRLKVIVHEYAHSLAHKHLKDNNMEYQQHREKYETEAEAIAYVVSKYLGLDTSNYSQTYLYSWSKNKDFKEIDDSFSTIVNYSRKIINNYNKIVEKELNVNSVSI